MSHDVVEKLTSIAVLHDHIELLLCLDDFIELNNIGMPDLLEYFDFSRYPLDILLVVNLVLLEDFNGHLQSINNTIATYLLSSEGVLTELYLSESSFSQMFA